MNKSRWYLLPASLLMCAGLFSSPAHAYEDVCTNIGAHADEIAQTLNTDRESAVRIAESHCANVGRKAYNALGPDWLRAIYLGPIQRVIWTDAGDIISQPGAPPRMSRTSGFMYIIGPGGVADHIFYRWGTDVAGR